MHDFACPLHMTPTERRVNIIPQVRSALGLHIGDEVSVVIWKDQDPSEKFIAKVSADWRITVPKGLSAYVQANHWGMFDIELHQAEPSGLGKGMETVEKDTPRASNG